MGWEPGQIAEREHRDLLAACGLEPDDVPGALAIATRLLGPGSVYAVPPTEVWGEGEATADEIVLVRDDLSTCRRDFVILHEVAEIWIQRRGYGFPNFRHKERVCDALAAALLAPSEAFALAVAEHRTDFETLAHEFGASQTAMALRYGEVTMRPVRVRRPGLVRVRGAESDWSSVVRLALTDEPDRLVELAA